jgi:hypothetical protein
MDDGGGVCGAVDVLGYVLMRVIELVGMKRAG